MYKDGSVPDSALKGIRDGVDGPTVVGPNWIVPAVDKAEAAAVISAAGGRVLGTVPQDT